MPELVLIALLVGWLFGGKFGRLADARIRFIWLIFVPLVMYVSAWVVVFLMPPAKVWFSGVSHIIGKASLLIVVAANLRLPGAKLILLGMVLNFVAIVSNGGMMPANTDAIASVFGQSYAEKTASQPHVQSALMDTATHLGFLCDIIAARRPFVLVPAIYSVGDLILSVGIFITIIAIMRTPLPSEVTDRMVSNL